jgi:cytochrome P450
MFTVVDSDLFFCNYRNFRKDPLRFLAELVKDHGDVVSFRLGPHQAYLLNHPDLFKDVLVTHSHKFMKGLGLQRAKRVLGEGLLTSEGEFHRRQRRLLQPAFHRDYIRAYGEVMTTYAAAMRDSWQPRQEIDIAEQMRHLTLAIVARALFHADVEAEATEIGQALTTAIELFGASLSLFAELLFRLPLPATFRFQKAHARLNACIYSIINARRASGKDYGDLLSMLLRAQDPEGGVGMTDQQVRDEAITLFLAGHETTANALAWTWYLLAQHPEAEHRLQKELDEVLGPRVPTVDDLQALAYTRKVFTESLRCFPPAWIMARSALEEHSIVGYRIKPGDYLLMSPYLIHHDARYYDDPFRFDPERWANDRANGQPPFTYLPFGAGPRICIGESFAWMEGILVIATLAQRWRPRLVPGHPVELQPLITLRPKYGIRMVLEPRS